MSYETISVALDASSRVATVTLNRPDKLNSFTRAMHKELGAALDEVEAAGTRALVLTGAGDKAFCAGGDLKEMSSEQLTIPPVDYVPQFGRNIRVDKPTIAAVNGVAFAGGFLLAQTCDLCVAATTATFAIPEPKVGRGAPWAAPLPLMIPRRIATELLLTAAPMTARRAYEVGFVNRLAEPADLASATQELARQIAANAPLSVAAGKQTALLTAEQPLSAAFDTAEELWSSVYHSEDAQEGMQAFAEKRAPAWKGA